MNEDTKLVIEEIKFFREEQREDNQKIFTWLETHNQKITKLETEMGFVKGAVKGVWGLILALSGIVAGWIGLKQ